MPHVDHSGSAAAVIIILLVIVAGFLFFTGTVQVKDGEVSINPDNFSAPDLSQVSVGGGDGCSSPKAAARMEIQADASCDYQKSISCHVEDFFEGFPTYTADAFQENCETYAPLANASICEVEDIPEEEYKYSNYVGKPLKEAWSSRDIEDPADANFTVEDAKRVLLDAGHGCGLNIEGEESTLYTTTTFKIDGQWYRR